MTRRTALQLHQLFAFRPPSSPLADNEVRSKDGVRFLVHKANLSTSSTVFADMFESATSSDQERPSIDLEESAEVLERLLGYCYPQENPFWDLGVMKDREFVRAVDKYHVPRAIEAGQSWSQRYLYPNYLLL